MSAYYPIPAKSARLAVRLIEALPDLDDGGYEDPYVQEVVIGWHDEPVAKVVPNEFGGFDLVQVPVRPDL